MDYLTKWPEAKPVTEVTAKKTVQFVYEDIICHHGCPGKILTDRGTHFNNFLLKGLLERFTIKHLMFTPYHPQTNGLVERFNQTLGEALARTAADHLDDWDKYIAPILFAYRTSKHSTTKVTPFYLVYGREAKLPIDDSKIEEERSVVQHIFTQLDVLLIARNHVQRTIKSAQDKQKDLHDRRIRFTPVYQIGDQVLYYRAALDNQRSGKLELKWKGPYYIHSITGNGAYKIRTIDGSVLKASINNTFLKAYKSRASLSFMV